MARRRLHLRPPGAAELAAAFADLRAELEVDLGFPDDVASEARAAAEAPRLPEADETEIPFVTIDPPGSRPRPGAPPRAARRRLPRPLCDRGRGRLR